MFPLATYRPEPRRLRAPTSLFQSLFKRGFDIVVATAGLLLLSPLILLISLAIKIDSSGPTLCRHKRYNSNNVEFEIFEFRTTLAADKRERTLNSTPVDMPSVTRLGQTLRHSGINKLPLLLNVMRGEISIVGSHLFMAAPGKAFSPLDLHEVRPGIISWAHVNDDHGESADAAKSIYRCIKCDLYYVEHYSLSFDMAILFRTILSGSTYS